MESQPKDILIFSDEAGAYASIRGENFLNRHPFFIRSNVMISNREYAHFQHHIKLLNERYLIPIEQEIKWSDIYSIRCGKYRNSFLRNFDEKKVKKICL